MVMIIHDAEGADVDGEEGGEESEAVFEPLAAMGEVAAGSGIEAAEESTADAAGGAMVDGDLVVLDIVSSGQSHGSLSFILSNEQGRK
jgi:hypothetical protein